MYNNPIMQYKQQSINTMSNSELIVKLYEEASKDLTLASKMFCERNNTAALICTKKAKDIFQHLISVLDYNYEISNNLYQLYSFFNMQIIRAEIQQSGALIDEITPLVNDLKNTWVEAQKIIHMNK
ncbi:flagellar export chaperone FliS [Paludicola sp. MB14-C6]|uniref:flagellar export chaperone FliS n=1 Tax=Paludihabitans sp. MB14-C6 TaxID=3070656 RepID=UPI0027DDF8D7|nr:flagellar export chaperone FliS [Paludicola sp. MB14-C6]WMJ24265.1 flagellar export chaperone FliS [Paludicola sp. MB14-C6]